MMETIACCGMAITLVFWRGLISIWDLFDGETDGHSKWIVQCLYRVAGAIDCISNSVSVAFLSGLLYQFAPPSFTTMATPEQIANATQLVSDMEPAWVDKVSELATRSISVESLLCFYTSLLREEVMP